MVLPPSMAKNMLASPLTNLDIKSSMRSTKPKRCSTLPIVVVMSQSSTEPRTLLKRIILASSVMRGEVIGVKYLGAGKAVVTFAEGYDTISYFDGSQTYQVHPTRGDFGIVEPFVHGEILSAVSYDQHGGNFYLDQYNYKTGA